MANDNLHIVRKVSFELTVPSRQHYHRGDRLSMAIREAVKNLGSLFDEHFGDALYRLDDLSVALNVQKADMPRLANLVEEALAEKVLAAMQAPDATGYKQDVEHETTQMLEKLTPAQQTQKLLCHFLRTGQCPWWAPSDPFSVLEKVLGNMPAAKWLETINPLVQNNVGALKRLAAQFPEALVQKLIQKSSGEASTVRHVLSLLKEIGRFLEAQHPGYGRRQQTMTRLYEKALAGMVSGAARDIVLYDLMIFANKDIRAEPGVWTGWLKKEDTNKKGEWLQVWEKHGAESTEKWVAPDDHLPFDEADGLSESKTSDVAVANGGLVLLHPFIEGLFDNLGLLEEGMFSSDWVCERAVCLLHYLATGSEEFREPDLVLAKFLCGWPLGQTINRFLPVSSYEKEECAMLLRSAIQHWDVLKNTSIDGLRSNFLQRKGILREEVFGWSLYLEHATQDILLEKLPWGLSVIKFKWMDEMLTVNWA